MKKIFFAWCTFVLAALLCRAVLELYRRYTPIRVGILHSLTGHMASSEKPVVDATLFAIEQINAKGGLLGRQIKPIVVDGASDPEVFAQQAKMLITEEKVSVIFGCWTSASRKEVKKIVEKYDHLLFYPVQNEGIEQSPNIIYTGETPNQQMFPALIWCKENIGNRFFIVGSDYVYPRVGGIIAKNLLESIDALIVGEEYVPLGSSTVDEIVEQIKKSKPDVIINMINGDTNIHFFKALRGAGITSEAIPTMSFSIAETEIKELGTELIAGDYAAWSYFQSIENKENSQFVQSFKERFGQDRTINDPMESAFAGVYLWYQTAHFIGAVEAMKIAGSVQNQSRVVPEGNIAIDAFNHYTWKESRIGKVNREGQFDIIWTSNKTIYPVVYPFKTREEWEAVLQDLFTGWGGAWMKN